MSYASPVSSTTAHPEPRGGVRHVGRRLYHPCAPRPRGGHDSRARPAASSSWGTATRMTVQSTA
eukprot:4931061-Lingulodinium_polyedra.AAC.1